MESVELLDMENSSFSLFRYKTMVQLTYLGQDMEFNEALRVLIVHH